MLVFNKFTTGVNDLIGPRSRKIVTREEEGDDHRCMKMTPLSFKFAVFVPLSRCSSDSAKKVSCSRAHTETASVN